jgi:hypothetical protein
MAGDYAAALHCYDQYLSDAPRAMNHDLVLVRKALAYSLPESPLRDPTAATTTLNYLIAQFPQSPWKPLAEFILNLQMSLDKLETSIGERDQQIRRADEQLRALSKTQAMAQNQAGKLGVMVETQRDRVRRLTPMATLPVDEGQLIGAFGPHLSVMTGARLSTSVEPPSNTATLLARPPRTGRWRTPPQRRRVARSLGGCRATAVRFPVRRQHGLPDTPSNSSGSPRPFEHSRHVPPYDLQYACAPARSPQSS